MDPREGTLHGLASESWKQFPGSVHAMPFLGLVLETPSSSCRSSACTIDEVSYNSRTDQFQFHMTLCKPIVERRGKEKNKQVHKRPSSNDGQPRGASSSLAL